MAAASIVARLREKVIVWLGRDMRSRFRRQYESRHGKLEVAEQDGVRLARIDPSDVSAYRTYREIQQAGNIEKLDAVFASQENIAYLARFAEQRLGQVGFVLCHGTRNGAEQRWFKEALSGSPKVIGTEISDTATQFPDTVQWDFHELNPEWEGKADVIYSNSWDHSIDPDRMFTSWMKSLSPRSVMMIEHTIFHLGTHADALDPFGATRDGIIALLNRIGGGTFEVSEVLTELPVADHDRCIIVVRRVSAPH